MMARTLLLISITVDSLVTATTRLGGGADEKKNTNHQAYTYLYQERRGFLEGLEHS